MLLPIAALERPSVQATSSARRVARLHAEAAPRLHETPRPSAATPPAAHGTSAATGNPDLLRDQYACDRLHRAVREYRSHAACECPGPSPVDCLLTPQPYRVALSAPPVEMRDAPALAAQRRLTVARVQDIGLDDGFESSRRRRRFGGWP